MNKVTLSKGDPAPPFEVALTQVGQVRHDQREEGALKRHHIAFLVMALAGCGGGGGMTDSGPADTGVPDTSMPDAFMPDAGPVDSGPEDAGPMTPRSTRFLNSSGGGVMTGGGFQMRISVGVTPAGRTSSPDSDLSLGANAALR
ncbi:MAG: hypothetical protein GXP55_24115 [Deltaproteobacteria bacterium]|nr:hypothetical protein [Deltaproteobacteria bacterium]